MNTIFLAQSTVKCDITCHSDQSCFVSLIASGRAYPGDIRSGSCSPTGECSEGYTVHCQKCYDFCKRKQNYGKFETAVITLGLFGKPINQTTRLEGNLRHL